MGEGKHNLAEQNQGGREKWRSSGERAVWRREHLTLMHESTHLST